MMLQSLYGSVFLTYHLCAGLQRDSKKTTIITSSGHLKSVRPEGGRKSNRLVILRNAVRIICHGAKGGSKSNILWKEIEKPLYIDA